MILLICHRSSSVWHSPAGGLGDIWEFSNRCAVDRSLVLPGRGGPIPCLGIFGRDTHAWPARGASRPAPAGV